MSENVQKAWVSRPVGGIPISDDLGPSIVFAMLYALLLPNIIYNFFIRKPRAWNVIQISTVIFAVERIAWCIIRAVQAAHPERRSSGGLMNYVQVTVALGFVGISSEAVKLLRCTLVNTTLPETVHPKTGELQDSSIDTFVSFSSLLSWEQLFLA
ncbi:mRNA-capping enzyme [Rhizoctonia solani]|uniref:mRNA-capping enzyme n=1 Tax=Rhizoctonia solani TaxID=456999 RepID=A0A8H8P6Z9_9AGAM|nr:mRNA-capping enzyme [Rhizoctonia solani]QRW25011.1 mRNA-capping enzyme [Rhizoctonia solani]